MMGTTMGGQAMCIAGDEVVVEVALLGDRPPRGGLQAQRAASDRERRREGYPPEGSRPRSGLGRAARSQSDAPGILVALDSAPGNGA